MLEMVLMTLFGVGTGILSLSQNARDRFNDALETLGLEAHALALDVKAAFRKFVVGMMVILTVYIVILVGSIIIGYQWVTFVALLMLAILMAPFIYVFYLGSLVLDGAASDSVKKFGQTLANIKPVLEPSKEWFNDGAGKKVVGGIASIFLFAFNLVYILPALTLKATGVAVIGATNLSKEFSKAMWWLSRAVSYVMIWVMLILSLQWFGFMVGTDLVDMWTLATFGLMLLVYLPVARMLDWVIGMVGIPAFSSALPAILALVFLVLALFAYKSPAIANGVKGTIEVMHDHTAQALNLGVGDSKTSNYTKYKVIKPILVTYKKVGNKYEPVQKATDAQNPIFKVGSKGVFPGGVMAPIKDSKVPGGLTQIYPVSDDPISAETEMVNIESATDKYIWVASDAVAVSDGSSSSSVGEEPETPAGWKEIGRGEVDVSKQFTDIGSHSGKVLIQLWGKATIDSTGPQNGPQGQAGTKSHSHYPVPGAPFFSAILKAGEQKTFLGSNAEFNFSQPTQLSIGPNDDGGETGSGFADNNGFWKYKISVPQ